MNKAMSEMWWILGTAFIVIVVVIILLLIFKQGSDSAFSGIKNTLTGFGDCDGDKVSDALDKCVCQVGPAANDGCQGTDPNAPERMKTTKDCRCI